MREINVNHSKFWLSKLGIQIHILNAEPDTGRKSIADPKH
jgi:hypothetical protein